MQTNRNGGAGRQVRPTNRAGLRQARNRAAQSGVMKTAMMRPLALAGCIGALALAGTAAPAAPGPNTTATVAAANLPLLGIVDHSVYSGDGSLARFNPQTLHPSPGRTALDGYQQGWSFSPNRHQLVFGNDNESCVGGATGLRFLDVPGMRTLGEVRLAPNGPVEATAWLDATHVLAIVAVSDCLTTKRTVVFTVNATSRLVVAQATLSGQLLDSTVTHGKLVLLLGPQHALGHARIATVDATGHVRQVVLGQINAGRVLPTPTMDSSLTRINLPGLAIDAGSDTAYVVPAGERLAAVNLRTLRVSYHDLSKKQSLFARFIHWLDPTAQAKGDQGPQRQALWLGNGLLAVTGSDSTMSQDANGHWSMTVTPIGLQIINTHSLSYRSLASNISQIQLTGGLLFATGSSYHADQNTSNQTYAGLTAYTPTGQQRYHLFGNDAVDEVAAIDGHGYAAVATTRRGNVHTITFNLSRGNPGRTYSTSLYQLLVNPRTPSQYGY